MMCLISVYVLSEVFPIIKSGKGPQNMTILEGHDALLNCMVDGQPPPSTFWLFQNKDISTNHTVFPNGSLKLDSVQNTAKYEGLYSCFAKNKAGESRKSNATLTVHGKFDF